MTKSIRDQCAVTVPRTMDNNQQKPLDPMFTLHRGRSHVPSYQRRPNGLKFEDIALLTHVPDTKPAAASAQYMQQSQEPIRTSGVSRQTAPATSHHQRTMRSTREAANSPPIKTAAGRRRRFGLLFKQTWLLYSMATTVFVVGLVVSIAGLRANHEVAKQVKQVQKADTASEPSGAVPSTTKPTPDVVQQYVVSPNVPRYIDIVKLSVHARVFSEGVDRRGQLQVPWNIYDTGWYNASAQPGQPGAMLVDGHSGVNDIHGVFYNLGTLVNGDVITITRGDGAKVTYSVAKVQTVAVNDVNMSSMLVSIDTTKPGLNLITCAGDQIPGTTKLDKRVLVYAVQQ